MDLLTQLQRVRPSNEQEEKDCRQMQLLLRSYPDLDTRKNACCHLTASAWVTNQTHDKVLMAYHNIYQSWSWLGGHADGDTDLLHTALREVREESGLETVRALSDDIFSVEILTVDGHAKRGEYVSSHLHLNVTYLLEADETQPVRRKADENSAVAWFSLEDAVAKSSEPWFRERIYPKLNEKLARFAAYGKAK